MMLSDAQQIMVEENLGLVRAVLSRCVNNPGSMGIYSYDDLFQIGCIGLCKAAAQYQPGRAVFSTYAYITIRNHIYNALAYATYRQEKEVLSEFLHESCSCDPLLCSKAFVKVPGFKDISKNLKSTFRDRKIPLFLPASFRLERYTFTYYIKRRRPRSYNNHNGIARGKTSGFLRNPTFYACCAMPRVYAYNAHKRIRPHSLFDRTTQPYPPFSKG